MLVSERIEASPLSSQTISECCLSKKDLEEIGIRKRKPLRLGVEGCKFNLANQVAIVYLSSGPE
jgi:hypothetical protein